MHEQLNEVNVFAFKQHHLEAEMHTDRDNHNFKIFFSEFEAKLIIFCFNVKECFFWMKFSFQSRKNIDWHQM